MQLLPSQQVLYQQMLKGKLVNVLYYINNTSVPWVGGSLTARSQDVTSKLLPVVSCRDQPHEVTQSLVTKQQIFIVCNVALCQTKKCLVLYKLLLALPKLSCTGDQTIPTAANDIQRWLERCWRRVDQPAIV